MKKFVYGVLNLNQFSVSLLYVGDIVQLGDKVAFRFNHLEAQALVSSYTFRLRRFLVITKPPGGAVLQ